MSSNKRVLFFTSFPPPFTGQRIASKLIFDLVNNYAEVDLINLSATQGNIERIWSVKLFFIYIQKYFLLVKKLKKKKYDYVYTVFAPSKFGLLKDYISAILVNRYGVKLFSQLQCGNYGDNFKHGIFKILFRRLISKVDTFIFLSPSLNKIDKLTDTKVFYLNNTVSGEVICTDEEVNAKIAAKLNREILEIYYISNMIKEKGYRDLVAAAEKLNNNESIHFKIHLIGIWPDDDKNKIKDFEKELKSSGMNDRVIIHGAINDRKKIKEHFLNADIFILPTYYSIEAQPLSIIEAFNSATPVISTLHAAIPDMIDNGLNGYLVHTRSPNEIADSILKLVPYNTWKPMAQHARNKYINCYTNDILLQKLIKLFNLD